MKRLLILLGTVAACAPPPDTDRVRVTIPRGAALRSIADTLHAHGVISSPRWFRFYVAARGQDRAIHAGTYDLPLGRPANRVLDLLTSGAAVATQRLVLPEGLMLNEAAASIESQLGIPRESILVAAGDPDLRARVGAGETLEGYLYPSTYLVRVGAGARDVVRQMVSEFESRWKPEWTARADSLGLSRHQVVILASIIEGEVRRDRDRRYVSSVYHNRMRRGMRLQADPTVIYALGTRRRLFERDYRFPSRYNTYLIDGLPPGPIGQPSAASLEAALYPARSDFLFLVARPDGHHIFSRTLREHLDAVREVRRMEGR